MFWAKMGSRAMAEAKKLAKKSSSMVERINGALKTKRSPSPMALQLTSGRTPFSTLPGTFRISSSAPITATYDIAL